MFGRLRTIVAALQTSISKLPGGERNYYINVLTVHTTPPWPTAAMPAIRLIFGTFWHTSSSRVSLDARRRGWCFSQTCHHHQSIVDRAQNEGLLSVGTDDNPKYLVLIVKVHEWSRSTSSCKDTVRRVNVTSTYIIVPRKRRNSRQSSRRVPKHT